MTPGQERFRRVPKPFTVKQLDEMLQANGQKAKGVKADKAQQVAWLYATEEIVAWIAVQNPLTTPATVTSEREAGQTSSRDFSQSQPCASDGALRLGAYK